MESKPRNVLAASTSNATFSRLESNFSLILSLDPQ
jgi:hypothetical protein